MESQIVTSARTIELREDNDLRLRASGMAIVVAIATVKFLFHIYFNKGYGYFRDEFDYMSCGEHLAWGYVDQPPLIPFLIHICRALLGDSLRSIRFVPALASSFLVVQTALIAREFGGRRFALVLSAVTIAIAPQYLSNGSLLGTNCLEPNLWMGCAYSVILAIKRADPRYWLWAGVIAGLGLEEKYSIALFGLAIVLGVILTDERRVLRTQWVWLGALVAFLIFLPNFLWNTHRRWPFLQLMHNIRAEGRDVILPAGQYFLQQTLLVHPLTAPIWIAGLIALFLWAPLRRYRVLGWSYVVCYGVFFLLHGKNYYLSPVYPMLLAAGAVMIEHFLGSAGRRRLKATIIAIPVTSGLYLAPVAVPILPPDSFIAYMRYLPMKLPVMEHSHTRAVLPQWYSDQFGWEEIVAETALAWNQLKPDERSDCGIFAQDYGQAGAIDFFGRRYGMPRALSGHQTWYLWGPGNYSGDCLIVLDDTRETLERLWTQVEYVGTSADNPYALEKNIDVFICRGKKFSSLKDLWPRVKHWR
ncbi:MAG: glycosyltransferase family 39 protein [Acidobacteria bacterium]|nr:glycosyltransferase family 39 protein [Acidobacteriota bacterium]